MELQWWGEPKEAFSVTVYADDTNCWHREVGKDGVTSILRTAREGMHSYIPYIEVWRGDVLMEEYCQHNVLGVAWIDPNEARASEGRGK